MLIWCKVADGTIAQMDSNFERSRTGGYGAIKKTDAPRWLGAGGMAIRKGCSAKTEEAFPAKTIAAFFLQPSRVKDGRTVAQLGHRENRGLGVVNGGN